MITNEEAIKIIKTGGWGYSENEVTEANVMAITALEMKNIAEDKQDPIKPFQDTDTKYHCPLCGNWIAHYQKYCNECGQKIDWSEVEE